MATSRMAGSTDFWKVNLGLEDDYWNSYEEMRPKYADSGFLELIYDYHSSKTNLPVFDVAYDIGCGFGKATIELVKRFTHVIASDSNESSIIGTQRRLASSASNVSFSCCSGEQSYEHHSPQSADVICAAECIPLMNSRLALSSFAQILKPNGTLAIWFYGRAHFSEPEYKVKCQPLFDRIMGLTFAKVMNGGDMKSQATWKRAADGMGSWLDNIDFPPTQWTQVQRRKWNSKSSTMGFSAEFCNFDIELTNCIRDGEKVIETEDPKVWQGTWNIQGVTKYIISSFPGIEKEVEEDAEIQTLFEELRKAMGGENAFRLYNWPIVLILATRSE